jgi:hypothetical protein
VIFSLYFDKNYLHWAELLIQSINLCEPDAQIIAYTVNMAPEISGQNVMVEPVTINPENGIELSWMIIEHKASFFKNSMEKFPGYLHVMLDSDMMVIKSLDSLKREMMGMDMGGIVVHDKKIAGGFLAANTTPIAEKFVAETSERLLDSNYFYDKDQPLLAEMYHKYMGLGMKWFHADRRYLDHLERDESYIWSAHKTQYGVKDVRFEKYKGRIYNGSSPIR